METVFSLLIAGFAVWFIAELLAKLESRYPDNPYSIKKHPISVRLKFLGLLVLFLLIQVYVFYEVSVLKDFSHSNFSTIVGFTITVVYFWIPLHHYNRVLKKLKKEQERTHNFH